ncbi:hypothetical protein QJQ45_016268, partial [Haematococcus lacustris]
AAADGQGHGRSQPAGNLHAEWLGVDPGKTNVKIARATTPVQGEDAEEDVVLRAIIKAPKFADLATRSKAAASTQAKDKSQLKTSNQMFEDVLDNGTYAGYRKSKDGGKCNADSLRQRISSLARTVRGEHHRVKISENDMAPILQPDDLMDFKGRFALMWKVVDGRGCVRRPPSHPRTWHLAYERACGSGTGCVRRPTSHPRTWQLAYERACGSGTGCVRRPPSQDLAAGQAFGTRDKRHHGELANFHTSELHARRGDQRTMWAIARDEQGACNDTVINLYLMSHYGLSTHTVAHLRTRSDWSARNLDALSATHGTKAFLCKAPAHSMAIRKHDGAWYLLDSQADAPTRLRSTGHYMYPVTCEIQAIISTANHTAEMEAARQRARLGPIISNPQETHRPYWERQYKQCCLVHAINMAMGIPMIRPDDVITHCKTLDTHIQDLANKARQENRPIPLRSSPIKSPVATDTDAPNAVLDELQEDPQQEKHLRPAAFLPWQERRERSCARMQGCGVSMEAFLEALNAAHYRH